MKTMDIKRELAAFKKDIDYQIEIYLDDIIQQTKKKDLFVLNVVKYFKKTILSGGKRIRPIMMYWGYRAAGGDEEEKILKTCISIELIHAFLLMHDDIIDRDDLRRGKKTIHAQYRDYNKYFLNNKDAEHFGSSIAIIFGDFVYSLGNRVLFESKFDPKSIVLTLNKMQDIVSLTCIGEMQDVYMEYDGNTTENDILKMYENKTARYTFEGPLQLGAMLADADDHLCEQLSTYAVPLGIAFQIRDDMLGIFGDTKKTGKPVGSDIAEGKKTLITYRAYQNATKEQKMTLNRLLGKHDINNKDIEEFQKVMIDTGARESVEVYMQELIKQSQDALTTMDLNKEVRLFLFSLAQYLNTREK